MYPLTVGQRVGVGGGPVRPRDERLADDGVVRKVDHGDVLLSTSVDELLSLMRRGLAYGVSRSVSSNKVDVERDDFAGFDDTNVVLIILILVSAALEEVALVVGIRYRKGVFDRAGDIAVELLCHRSSAKLFLLGASLQPIH